jgi:hypothetical protein
VTVRNFYPVAPDLMPFSDQKPTLYRERLNCVSRHEPGRFEIVFRQKVEKPLGADLAELAAGQCIGRFRAKISNP